jgi:transposase
LYDVYQAKVAPCDVRIEAVLKRLRKAACAPVGKPPPVRTTRKQSNNPAFDVRAALHGLLGCDVTQIHGLGPCLALKLVAECRTNLSVWPNAKQFTSWLCLSPSNKLSGGKVLSSRTRRSGSRAPHRRGLPQLRSGALRPHWRHSFGVCPHVSARPRRSLRRLAKSPSCSTIRRVRYEI